MGGKIEDAPWFAKPLRTVYQDLETTEKGLQSAEAEKRLEEYGTNSIKEDDRTGTWKILISQFTDFLVFILLIAAAVSFFADHQVDFYLILSIVVANGLFGFIQDWKAEQSIQALKEMAAPTAEVLRDGQKKEIAEDHVVPGDIIFLGQGSTVPADARLLDQESLAVDESALTGESIPSSKRLGVLEDDTPLAERANMVHKFTNVVRGRGRAVVIHTGMDTEIGSVARQLQDVESEPSPFQKDVNQFGKRLGVLILLISALIVPLTVLLHGSSWLIAFLTAVALAVAAIPEGLPAVVTLALALGTRKMVKRNALVRRLPIVESLGSVDTICTDKTGTLTENEMVVSDLVCCNSHLKVSGGYSEEGGITSLNNETAPDSVSLLLKIGMLCNNAEVRDGTWKGDPTEIALYQSAQKWGLEKDEVEEELPRIREIPFSSKRKRMTTLHRGTEADYVFMKGAPDTVLKRCSTSLTSEEEKELTNKRREKIDQENARLARKGLRVLGFAFKKVGRGSLDEAEPQALESDLTFLGLQGMLDPPRKGVKEAIQDCREAGIRTVMITGDNALTAETVGKQLDFGGEVLTGQELDRISDDQLRQKVKEVDIFARVSPSHKVEILQAFKDLGHVVAMTGDGVNDAPSLKLSDIGIAMGIRGTDVTKRASDMVLLDDNFKSIRDAVAEGRAIFDNIRKFVNLLLSGNLGEVLTVFLGTLSGLGLPLTAVMLLWVNLLTDGLPALALGADSRSEGVMKRSPAGNARGVVNRRMIYSIVGIGISITVIMIGSFAYLSSDLRLARTVVFTELVLLEMIEIWFIRRRFGKPVRRNYWLSLSVALSVGLQLVLLYSPLNRFFGVVPLGLYDWLFVIAGLSAFSLFMLPYSYIGDRLFGRESGLQTQG